MTKSEGRTRLRTVFFLEVLKAGGLGKAARRLGVSTPQMSRELSLLEGELGVKLLERNSSGVKATAEGAFYAERMDPLLDELSGVERTVLQSRKMNARILLPPAAGTLLIPGWIADFQKKQPYAEITYDLENGDKGFARGGFDFCVEVSREPSDDTKVAHRISEVALVNVASPDYLSSAGDLFEPEALRWHRLWYAPSETETPVVLSNGASSFRVDLSRASASPGLLALLSTVRAGGGVGIAIPAWLAAEDLSSGRLAEVLPQWKLKPEVMWLLRPPSRFPSLLGQQLVALFREKAKEAGFSPASA